MTSSSFYAGDCLLGAPGIAIRSKNAIRGSQLPASLLGARTLLGAPGDRSFDGSFRVDGHAELDGPPLPFQVSLPVPLGHGNLGLRVAPLSVQYTLS